ncbi:MAG TPA: DinB family protein [Chryseosolibacter sp.]
MENVLVNSFVFLFERELGKLQTEIEQYPDEKLLWQTAGQISNPPGTLCLHLCGNLQNYIGATLGKSGYVRNRPYEFAARGLTKQQLLDEISRTKASTIAALTKLHDADLHRQYPEEVLGYPMTTVFFLNHLFGHFGYHLGQINYHRRMISACQV